MLLSQLINQQQSAYASIQSQIEALQEQQRQINAYLQRLGSVESQMVSAAQVIQEAIASINEVCPDELAGYKDLITGLFNKPTATIAPSSDEPQPTPPSDNEIIEVVSLVVDNNDGDDEPDPTLPSEEPTPSEQTEAVETFTLLQQVKEAIASLSYAEVKEILVNCKLDTKGKQMALKDRLMNHCETMNEVQLQSVWEYLSGSTQKAA